MYSAHIDDENMEAHGIKQLAKEIAIPPQGGNPLDFLSDEDTRALSTTLPGLKIRAVEGVKAMIRTAAHVA